MDLARRRTATGAVLLVLAVLVWALRVFLADGGPHSWDPGAKAPATVHLTRGTTYAVSVPGGPAQLIAAQLSQQPQLTCSATANGTSTALGVTVDVSDVRVTDRVGTFVSPLTGTVSVTCSDAAHVFVDDADDAAFDAASGLVVVCAVLALAGAGLLLSGLYLLPRRTDGDTRTDTGTDTDTDSDTDGELAGRPPI